MRKLRTHLKNLRYSREVRRVRNFLAIGDRVRIFHANRLSRATVTNVRTYAHGSPEVYVLSEEGNYIGWVSVECVFPLSEVPK